jgi:20S proteasome subunit alpha 2
VSFTLTAVKNSETAVVMRASNGIIIATENKLPTFLADEISTHKIQNICNYMGVTYSGIKPDFEAFMLVKGIAEVTQDFTQLSDVRPFGTGMIVCGYDENRGP